MESFDLEDTLKQIESVDKYNTIFLQKCVCLTEALQQQQFTIDVLILKLGPLLVNTSPEKRELGTLVLSQIFQNLPDDFLSSTELDHIASFYSDRLKDHHQVIPAVLLGLVALVQMTQLPKGAPHKLLSALFQNVPCQQQQLKDRQLIYQMFKELLDRRREEIRAMGIDYVLGVIQAIDGERDPRNLFLLFSWIPNLLQNVNLGHLAEEMFDVIACYFPVDFRAPSQDAQTITREDLAEALCPCLCAVPEFAEFCIPLLIEKLDSSLKIAKLDSINLLTESCKTFDVTIYEQHSHDIWDLLQKETLNSSNSEIEEAGLNAINAIINRLSQSENDHYFKQIVRNLYDSLKGNLRPDTKLFIPSSKVLLAIARASQQSCNEIVQTTVQLLLNHFNLTTNTAHKEILFRTLIEFTIAYIKLFNVTNLVDVTTLKEIPALCLQTVLHPEIEIQIVSFESLARIAKTIPENIRNLIYEVLKTELISRNRPLPVRTAVLKCFKIYANIYATEVNDKILSSTLDLNNDITLSLYLDALSTIVTEISFTELVLMQIVARCTSSHHITAAKISLKCLRTLLESNSNNDDIQLFLYAKCRVIDKLTEFIFAVIQSNQLDSALLHDVSTVIKFIVGYQAIEEQELIVKLHMSELLDSYRNNEEFRDKIIIVLEGFLFRLKPEIEIREKYEIIRNLLHVSATIDEVNYLYASQLIANILNKSNEDENFINILKEIEEYVYISLENSNNTLHVKNVIQLISWITKSLIVKGSNKSELWTDKLISLLDNHKEAAICFKLIMDDSYDCLSTKSYCSNRLLYRQKFFAYVCKKLSNNYNENTPNYLLALGYLLQLAPQQVIILYFKETLRLLIFCLELCKDPEVLCAVLNTICNLVLVKEPYLENHIEDLLPRFLNLTNFELSMKVRIAALKCIEELPRSYPVFKLLPHKQMVVFGLISSLDDKKRLVRRQAVEARSCWFLMDAPI